MIYLENRQKNSLEYYPTYRVGCSNALFLEIIEGELNYERSQKFNFRVIPAINCSKIVRTRLFLSQNFNSRLKIDQLWPKMSEFDQKSPIFMRNANFDQNDKFYRKMINFHRKMINFDKKWSVLTKNWAISTNFDRFSDEKWPI